MSVIFKIAKRALLTIDNWNLMLPTYLTCHTPARFQFLSSDIGEDDRKERLNTILIKALARKQNPVDLIHLVKYNLGQHKGMQSNL